MTEVSLNLTAYDIVPDGTVQLTATVKKDGRFDDSVTWKSSDSTIAEVDATKNATAKSL